MTDIYKSLEKTITASRRQHAKKGVAFNRTEKHDKNYSIPS